MICASGVAAVQSYASAPKKGRGLVLPAQVRIDIRLTFFLLLCVAWSARAGLDFAKDVRPALERLCFKCHGAEKAKGGVRLDEFNDVASLYRQVKLWESVVEQIRDRAMPPDDKPQPEEAERTALIEWLEHALDHPDPALIPKDPGRPFLHRLSRLEYNNTMRDLLGIESRPADAFPPDGGGGGGFDNNSATLFIPPVLVEKYLASAVSVLAEAKPERIFSARPNDRLSAEAAAKSVIADFAERAFRRPIEAEEVDGVLKLFAGAQSQGESWEESVKFALRGVLVSPHFLFRVEKPRGAEPHRLQDFEMASRLSYFLWSSMPDAELFQVAREGKLFESAVLEAQVRRMLRDPKARDFAENFSGQWLRVHELEAAAQPDPEKFSEYTPELRHALMAEPVEFFHALIREDGSLLRMIDADYTYVNERLAKHYGLPGVAGDVFQRVALPDRNRGGVVTMGAVLTITSYPRRTSPVLRGKWILEELLGTPPPPPPPLVESLPPSDKVRDGLTFRQQLEKHRKDPNCAGCHEKLDPLGFGLENFDPIGRWRDQIAGQPIDASGVITGGQKFNGAAELKQLLLARKETFARNVTEKMYAYALSRGLEYYDLPLVKETVKKLMEADYRVGTLVTEIVKSYPFQYRRGTDSLVSKN